MQQRMQQVFDAIKARDPNQVEFLQAVEEVLISLEPLLEKYPEYYSVLPALAEPERVIQFRVPWQDDKGQMQVNRGFRVQFNQAIGPYKGGLRLHPSVNLSIIKFLGFEQIFKNSLTTLPMGGGKGGSDFNPKGKSDAEVLRFCQSFMTELAKHIGPDCDVPAGDIGVGGREIGFMYGQYKRLTATHVGVLTGKGWGWGGSLIRPEATGYGLVYIVDECLKAQGDTMKGKRVLISGSGNVAQYAAEKVKQLGGKVLTLSDSNGTLVNRNGISCAQLKAVMDLKNVKRGRCSELAGGDFEYFPGATPWGLFNSGVDIVLPCATQNEIQASDVAGFAKAGAKLVAEGANMPSSNGAIEEYVKMGVQYIPGKASNAGGVAVSGLEMCQNSGRDAWTSEQVDGRLASIMKNIFETMSGMAKELGRPGDYQLGANAAGFKKVADAMIAQGMTFSN